MFRHSLLLLLLLSILSVMLPSNGTVQAHGPVTTQSKTVNGFTVEFERNTLTNVVAGEPLQYIARLLKSPIDPAVFDSAFIRIRDAGQQTAAAAELVMDSTDPGSAKMNAVMPDQGQYIAEIIFHNNGQELAKAEFNFEVFPAIPRSIPASPLKKYLAMVTFFVGLAAGAGFMLVLKKT